MGSRRAGTSRELVIVPKAADAPKLWTKRYPRNPDSCEPAHVHRFFEVVYVEAGRGFHEVDGERMELSAGDLCWMRPGQHHDPSGLATTEKWILAFSADAAVPELNEGHFFLGATSLVLLPFAPSPSAPKTSIPVAQRSRWLDCLNAIQAEMEQRSLGYAEAACAHLRLALLHLARLSAGNHAELQPARPLLAQVFAFIEARYRTPIGLREVAEAVGRSPAYLTDLVRRETGRTVLQWVIDRRLAEARRLLLQSEAPIGAIAEEVGYLDAKHFTSQFRRAHGVSPHAWRSARQRPSGKSA